MLTLRIERRPGGIWLWLCRFAYRRLVHLPLAQIPVGIPAMRDPHAPCDAYAPRRRLEGEWGDCQTDGHYQCNDCAHMARCLDCGKRIRDCGCQEEEPSDGR